MSRYDAHYGPLGRARYTASAMPHLDIHIPLFPSGVGSTHHTDAETAIQDILRQYWRMPFWPQLPQRVPGEMMLPQFGLDLPGAAWDGATLHWTGPAPMDAAVLPAPERAAGLHALLAALGAIPRADQPRVVKGQIVGPLTLSLAMRDADGRPPHADQETLLWLARAIGAMAAAQVRALGAHGAQVVLVFDEPALAAVEEPSLPLTWRQANAVLAAAFAPVQALGAIAGVHCCQPPNWTRALQSRPNLIHFDAQPGRIDDVIEHKSAIREHVARGGYLGWGLWPTAEPAQGFDAQETQYFLGRAARDLSFVDASVGLIFKRSFLSGVCGGAGLSAAQAERMASDLEDLSMGIRKRYWIAATTDVDPDHPLT